MKKLMMTTAALALMAGFAQAAVVSWSSGTIKDPVTGLNIGATTDAYLAQVWFYTDAAGLNEFAAGGTLTDTTSSSLGSNFQGSGNTFTDGAPAGTYYAQMIITSTDGLWKMDSGIVALGAIPNAPAVMGLNFSSGQGTLEGTAGGTTFTSGWEQIPEPTSVALLMLGVAAIGLRRRFRK